MLQFSNKLIQRLVYCPALFFVLFSARAQPVYFQQEVNYTMQVRLDDQKHSITAQQTIQYINHSASTLNEIYMHLWPNAYKDRKTALCQQLVEHGNTSLYFSEKEERGYIDSLNFTVNGKPIKWDYDVDHIDICKLSLNAPIAPGDTVVISTPFYVKIPSARFSRLGHMDQAYFMTQWYPKPAVYDQNGWHAMPYLDQGEFYSEFGNYDVSITLPKNYVLAATGDRIDAEEEEQFLNGKVIECLNHLDDNTRKKEGMRFPPSDSVFKTVRFKQSRVHDFAWFADKRYYVIHDQVELPTSKRVVDTWVFFTDKNFDQWKKAIQYVNESTLFYSNLLGDYPYNHVTAVDGTIMAGGGMEYPNITVIGDASNDMELDITITHEVGHNWFYGVLGSNERDYPFMDEGINSFYEMRYARAKYPNKTMAEWAGKDSSFNFLHLNKMPYWKAKEITYFLSLKNRSDQPINLSSDQFTPFNYGSVVYGKTPLVLDYLLEYIGSESFDKAMQFYFEQYKFKHPSPSDFINSLSHFSGIDLKAFEHYFINTTTYFDYAIKKVKRQPEGSYELVIKNKQAAPVPFALYGFKNNKPLGVVWSNGFEGKQIVRFPPSDVDYFKLDGMDRLPDINRSNNAIKTKGFFKKSKPVQLNFLTALDEPDKNQINFLPIVGANFYNGFMLGLAFHNYSLYKKRFEYHVAPMYAFNTKTISGFAEANYAFFPKRTFRQINVGLQAKSFAYDYFNTSTINENLGTHYTNVYLNYYKLRPFVEFELKKKTATHPIKQSVRLSSAQLFTDSLKSTSITVNTAPQSSNHYSYVNDVTYRLQNTRVIDPLSLTLNLQVANAMTKVSATYVQKITVSKNHEVEIRLFAGTFLGGTNDQKGYYAFRASGYTGYQDYAFDHNFMARNERNGLGFSQFAEVDGALKVWTPLGQSGTWLAGLNIKSPKLRKLPLRFFVDAIFCDASYLNTDPYLWDAGINISVIKDVIEIYVPLIYSNDIRDALELNHVDKANTIRFTLNIHKFAPGKVIQSTLQE